MFHIPNLYFKIQVSYYVVHCTKLNVLLPVWAPNFRTHIPAPLTTQSPTPLAKQGVNLGEIFFVIWT